MRLPKDPENWTSWHAERVLARAWNLFDKYEQKVDFDHRENSDGIYLAYSLAREIAVEVCTSTCWRAAEARALP